MMPWALTMYLQLYLLRNLSTLRYYGYGAALMPSYLQDSKDGPPWCANAHDPGYIPLGETNLRIRYRNTRVGRHSFMYI